jgi:hypothetical protein
MAAPGPSASLFSSYDVVSLQLKAPFNDLIDTARTDDDYAVTGTLRYTDGGHEVTVEGVKVSLRGHTSKRESECAFPKLKLQLPADTAGQGTLLSGLTSLKIGTHCGDAAADTVTEKYGRLANEQSPLREAFVYRLLDAVGVPALKARPAKIAYIFADARDGLSTTHTPQPVVRNGMLLENSDAAVKRVGAKHELDVKAFTDARAMFSAADTARLAFAEAMIGNFDWCLKFSPDDIYRCNEPKPLWNVLAFERGTKAALVMKDFDLAGMVVGHHPWFATVFNPAFVPSKSEVEIEVLAQVQRVRSLFPRAQLDALRRGFLDRKTAAYSVLDTSKVDEAGRRIARAYLDNFFKAIDDAAFYRPVVVKPDTQVYADAQRTKEACGVKDVFRIGTPVNEVQKSGTMSQVVVLDAMWRWAQKDSCDLVRTGPVWIASDSVGRDYPSKN